MRYPIFPKRKIKPTHAAGKGDGPAESQLVENLKKVVIAKFDHIRLIAHPRKVEALTCSFLVDTITEVERALIWNALVRTQFNVVRAARLLGVGRHFVSARVRQLGLYESLEHARGQL